MTTKNLKELRVNVSGLTGSPTCKLDTGYESSLINLDIIDSGLFTRVKGFLVKGPERKK